MIEASNCIDAAGLDSVGVLNSWHARIEMLQKKQRMHEIDRA